MLKAAKWVMRRVPRRRFARSGRAGAWVFAGVLALAAMGRAQTAAGTLVGPAPAQSDPQAQTAPAQRPAPVTTTVVVHGELSGDYLPESVTVGTLGGEPLKSAPLSAMVITRSLLNDQVARLLSDVVKNDASIEDDYVPVGYYGDYMIRGFPMDLATGLEIDGLTIAGEQDVPLENKESVEILTGLAGVESGVASAGGLVGYVTKPPAAIKDVEFGTDQRGTAYGALDWGRFFGSRKQAGARVNLAGERIATYMNDTNGWRAVGAGAANWKMSAKAELEGNFEYQHKTERDGSGYQLLGGTTLPDIHRIYASTMLGDQPWVLPDTYDTFNANARVNDALSPRWSAFAAAGLSHSLIQDNVIYAYGTPFDANGNVSCPGAPNAPAYFFCPDGTYGIYDYRDPSELRMDGEAEAMATGHIRTGKVTQDVTFGGVVFLRSVRQPGFYSVDQPSTATIADGAVYAYVGAENIYQPMAPVAAPGSADSLEAPLETAGPRRLWEDSHQASGVVEDRVHLPGRLEVIAGGRYDRLRDHNYSLWASCTDFSMGRCAPVVTNKPVWLPEYAVTASPAANVTVYVNYGVLLSLGPQGPWWVDNASQFLAPFFTRQVEAGAKWEPGQRILLSGDFFHMRAPFIYPKVIEAPDNYCTANEFYGPGDLCFESEGRETHNGMELNAEGKAENWLRVSGSAAAIHAVSTNTGTAAFDNRQVIDVPRLHTTVFADVSALRIRGLHVMPGWSYTSRKEATRDDAVSVPGYNLFNLGARYTPGGERGRMTLRLYADNISNKRYWKDTGASYGDTFIHQGAPATVRLSAHYTF